MRITEGLLRKRAEHNEGRLTDLKEVSLHQQDIEKIEVIGSLCRQLRILYLQNNLIPRIENLHRLQELEYLNLALNNVTRVEGLQRCECLAKLDLTLNFVDTPNLSSVRSLQANEQLRDLYLVGNPCTQWHGYRHYVVAVLPQLKRLDGEVIRPSERILAEQQLDALEPELREVQPAATSGSCGSGEGSELDAGDCGGGSESARDVRRPWCPETRLLEHREAQRAAQATQDQAQQRQAQAGGPPQQQGAQAARGDPDRPFPEIKEGQRTLQKNEGSWRFVLQDGEEEEDEGGREQAPGEWLAGCGPRPRGAVSARGAVTLRVQVGKLVDTSLIRADVQPGHVRVMVKGLLLQLELPCEVRPDASVARRSKASGELVITMPKHLEPGKQGASPSASLRPHAVPTRGGKDARQGGSDAVRQATICYEDNGDMPPLQ